LAATRPTAAGEEPSVERFNGLVAIVTGGASGMGRELVRQLAAEGCDVATCDVDGEGLAETRRLALEGAPAGTTVCVATADVADESQVVAFRDAAVAGLGCDHVDLLFNNAGIAGGGSFVAGDRGEWEKTFGVDFFGVLHATRAFLPLLLASPEGHVVNTSSINGIFASIGPQIPHTSYAAAKFAVKGFTEALICDFRVNAPNLHAHVVHPGHVGTSIVLNSARAHEREPDQLDDVALAAMRHQLAGFGLDADAISDEDLRKGLQALGESFRDVAPLTAGEAATIILDGVRADRWRILVGADAVAVDEMVRADPEAAYTPEFFAAVRQKGHFGGFGV
jgi:NAD(P)-dependent dehydrogenase (short-subunit alcohol dehydrogenase family)